MGASKNVSVLFCWGLLAAAELLGSTPMKAQYYDVSSFGAVGDAKTDNTRFIQRAIDSCSINGGTVYIPKGVFLSATLYLKSDVTIHLSAGAVLLGQPEAKFYSYQDAGIRFYGEQWAKQALIFCKNQKNVAIQGTGIIDGQGAAFLSSSLKKPDRYKDRPYLLWFSGCENISVTGVQLRNSAFWMQHYLGCNKVRIDGISIWNHSNKNNDMIDIDGCSQVSISNVIGDSDDDGITIKSTSPLISEHIVISNCILSSHCSAIKFGTESVGGFRNIAISNCVIKPSANKAIIYGKPAGICGLAIEMVDGGVIEHINVNNLIIDGAEVPIFLRLGNRARKYIASAGEPKPGIMRDINISDVTATGAGITGCAVSGINQSNIENVSLNNIHIEFSGGGQSSDVSSEIKELEALYPEATMFGKLNAYGFFVRHVKGISMSQIHVSTKKPDQRPAFFVEDVKDFVMVDLYTAKSGTQVLVTNSSDGVVSSSSGPSFLKTDKVSKRIKLRLN